MRIASRALLGLVVAAVAAAALTASAGAAASSTAAGTLTFCSDITYPPEEFYQGTKPVGSDIDIGNQIARRLGLSARFQNTGFDAIVAALLARRCDMIISGMSDTPARRKQVAFVDYLSVGESLMVKKGNPKKITTLASLAGKTVSVEVGTTNKETLDKVNAQLKKQGKAAIKIVAFPKDTDAAAALKTGRVDAYFGDAPPVAYYVSKDPSLTFAGSPVAPSPIGVALRKGDPNIAKVRKAIKAMYADGTMLKILRRWKLEESALKKP